MKKRGLLSKNEGIIELIPNDQDNPAIKEVPPLNTPDQRIKIEVIDLIPMRLPSIPKFLILQYPKGEILPHKNQSKNLI